MGSLFVDTGSDRPAIAADRSNWLNDTLRQFNFVALMRERVLIRRTCLEAMRAHREATAALPGAPKQDLYARVIESRGTTDAAGVRLTLRRAEESYAQWPVERELTFRDLVAYIAVTDYLAAHPEVGGVRSDVLEAVARAIPAEL